MNMNTAFDREIAAHGLNAVAVYDRLHVIAKFGRKIIDRVRVDQPDVLRRDGRA